MHDHVSPTVNKSISDCIQWTLNCSNRNKNEPFGHLRGDDPMKTAMQCAQIIGHNLPLFEKKQYWAGKIAQDSLTFKLYNYVVPLPYLGASRPELLFTGSIYRLPHGLELANHALIPRIIKRFLYPPKHPNKLQVQTTQLPIPWVLEALCWGYSGYGMKMTPHLNFMQRLWCMEIYHHTAMPS